MNDLKKALSDMSGFYNSSFISVVYIIHVTRVWIWAVVSTNGHYSMWFFVVFCGILVVHTLDLYVLYNISCPWYDCP